VTNERDVPNRPTDARASLTDTRTHGRIIVLVIIHHPSSIIHRCAPASVIVIPFVFLLFVLFVLFVVFD